MPPPSTSSPSTTASTALVQARPITSFFRPEQTSSIPAAPPDTAPAAAAVESTAAAAGTATGANMVATALAQQPVADSLAAAFREGIAITPPQYHTLQGCGSSTIRYRQCYHTPHYYTPYAPPLLWVCGSAITPRGISHRLRGSCELHSSPGLHIIPHPVIFKKKRNVTTGV